MVMFDSRPGAVEDLFVTHKVNDAGAYTLRFYINGMEAFVTVDDYVPVVEKSGKKVPVYAKSMHEGEIWPMIMEKAWAKLIGSYAASEGGNSSTVLAHLTNDPIEYIRMRNKGFTGSNEKGDDLWHKM